MTENTRRVLVLGKIDPAGPALLRARPGLTVDIVEQDDPALPALFAQASAVIVRTHKIDAALIDSAPDLAVVARHGVGYDAVDVAALTRRGIPLTIAGTSNALSVAEHALFMILSLAKNGFGHDKATRGGDWGYRDTLSAGELEGKTLLVVGFGRIGTRVARLALAFGMMVSVYDPYVDKAAIRDAGCNTIDMLDKDIGVADYVTLHAPLNHETDRIIGAPQLAAMKKTAFLINTARGGLIDEAALTSALTEHRIAGAGLDVFEVEPPAADNPLFALDAVILSPHIAGVTPESALRMSVQCAHNVLAVFDGTVDPAMVVNTEVLERTPPA